MKLKKIIFKNFKSLRDATLEVDDRVTALVGENETGKTNVLEAIRKFNDNKPFDPYQEKMQHSKEEPEIFLYFEIEHGDEEFYNVLGLHGAAREKTKTIVVSREKETFYLISPSIFHDHSSLKDQVLKEQIDKIRKEKAEKGEGVDQNLEPPLLDKKLLGYRVVGWIRKHLPQIEYFPGYYDAAGKEKHFIRDGVTIRTLRKTPVNYPSLVKLLSLGNLKVNDEFEGEEHVHILQKASREITARITNAWSQEKNLEIGLFTAEGKLVVKVKDGKIEGDCWMSPKLRSDGFQWYLSFYARFLAELENKVVGKILLFDEPGIFLHAEGQRQLLGLFDKIADNGNQIIYTTHSPFMLDPLTPERMRLLKKESAGTEIKNKAWTRGGFGRLPNPIRNVVGGLLVDSLFSGKTTLIVEGPSDRKLLLDFLKFLVESKKVVFDLDCISFLSTYGVSQYRTLISILQAEGVESIALLDSDTAGREARDLLLDRRILKKEDIILIGEALSSPQRQTLEDLIPKQVFTDAINNAYKLTSKWEPKGGYYPIIPRVREWLLKQNIISSEDDVNKIAIAEYAVKHFSKVEVFDEVDAVKDEYKKLFQLLELLVQKLQTKQPSRKKN